MSSIVAGLAGGLIATVLMTVVMMVIGDGGPPPTASLVAKFADGTAEDYRMPGMVLHLVYGMVAGVVLAVGVPLVGLSFGSVLVATAIGLVYGAGLTVVGMGFWMRVVVGMESDRDAMVQFAVVHAVYGVVLGALLGSGLIA